MMTFCGTFNRESTDGKYQPRGWLLPVVHTATTSNGQSGGHTLWKSKREQRIYSERDKDRVTSGLKKPAVPPVKCPHIKWPLLHS
jgi:hypothetical protein